MQSSIYQYLDRHPEFRAIHPVVQDPRRISCLTETTVKKWIKSLGSVISFYQIQRSNIWNLDETSLRINSTSSQLVVASEDRCTIHVPAPPKPANCTLVVCISADGLHTDSTLVWPLRNPPSEFSSFSDFGIRLIVKGTGWVNEEIYEDVVTETVLPSLEA